MQEPQTTADPWGHFAWHCPYGDYSVISAEGESWPAFAPTVLGHMMIHSLPQGVKMTPLVEVMSDGRKQQSFPWGESLPHMVNLPEMIDWPGKGEDDGSS